MCYTILMGEDARLITGPGHRTFCEKPLELVVYYIYSRMGERIRLSAMCNLLHRTHATGPARRFTHWHYTLCGVRTRGTPPPPQSPSELRQCIHIYNNV